MTEFDNTTTSKIRIDPELRDWIIPLKPEEYSELEKSIVSDGCRDPLVVWDGVLADGHHRFKICTEHNVPFTTVEKSFAGKDEVKLWMVRNQIARRNLESLQRIALVMKGEDLIAQRAKENLVTNEPKYINISEPLVNLPKAQEPINTTPDSPQPTPTQTTPKVSTPINTRKEAATLAKVSEKTYAKGKEVLKKAAPEVIAKVMSGDVSIHKAYIDIRRGEKKEERQKNIVQNPVIPDGKYDILLADPPWQYQFSETQTREIENQYPTMTLVDIQNMKIPIEDNAVLFLWATAPKLEEAISVLIAWGFTYKTCAIWDKEVIGMGYWFRVQHELLLVGVKGTFRAPEPEDRVSSVIRSHRSSHSSKPLVVYEILERMFPNRKYLEVFARSRRDGWVSWGNQI
jgi:N6-adenosine-specific RNA methylase IME4